MVIKRDSCYNYYGENLAIINRIFCAVCAQGSGKEACMFLLLLLFWIVLNGKITLEILLTGVVLSAALCWVSGKLCGWSFRRELQMLALLPRLVRYFFLRCGIFCCRICWSSGRRCGPRVHIAPSHRHHAHAPQGRTHPLYSGKFHHPHARHHHGAHRR